MRNLKSIHDIFRDIAMDGSLKIMRPEGIKYVLVSVIEDEITDKNWYNIRIGRDVYEYGHKQSWSLLDNNMINNPGELMINLFLFLKMKIPERIVEKYNIIETMNNISLTKTNQLKETMEKFSKFKELDYESEDYDSEDYESNINAVPIEHANVPELIHDLSLAFLEIRFINCNKYDIYNINWVDDIKSIDRIDNLLMCFGISFPIRLVNIEVLNALELEEYLQKIPNWFWKKYNFDGTIKNMLVELENDLATSYKILFG